MRHTENGVFTRLQDCFERVGKTSLRSSSKMSVFESVEDYENEYSNFSDLVLDNFRIIFLYYFLFCSLLLATFYVHQLLQLARIVACVTAVFKFHWWRILN